MKSATKAIRFLEQLKVPEGPKAGDRIKLPPFQKKFIKGALADDVSTTVLSIGTVDTTPQPRQTEQAFKHRNKETARPE